MHNPLLNRKHMDITIIIVSWNTRDLLRDCLYSIRQCGFNGYIDIIIVDNASNDGTTDMVKDLFPNIRLINSGGNLGFAKANNLALPYADTSLILFLNPDTKVEKDTLQLMVNFMNTNSSIGALSCKAKIKSRIWVDNDTDEELQQVGLQWFPSPITEFLSILLVSDKTIARLKNILPIKDPNRSGYVKKLYGTCLMIRKEVVETVGCFDERFFMYCEDVDLSKRIYNSGWKLYYLSEAEIFHVSGGASTKASNNFSTLMRCESISLLMQKYYGPIGKFFYRAAVFAGSEIRIFALCSLKAISAFKPIYRNINFSESLSKYITMAKWSLNLKKPIIRN